MTENVRITSLSLSLQGRRKIVYGQDKCVKNITQNGNNSLQCNDPCVIGKAKKTVKDHKVKGRKREKSRKIVQILKRQRSSFPYIISLMALM